MKTDSEYMDELKALMAGPRNFSSNLSKCGKYAELRTWLKLKTEFLQDDGFYTFGTRIFHVVNGFNHMPVCANPDCGKPVRVNFNAYADASEYGKVHCCVRCAQLNPAVQKKIETTNKARHGCRRGLHTAEFHEKLKGIFLEKYGVDSPLKDSGVRQKISDSLFEKYGVRDSPFQAKTVYNRAKQTCFERYGAETPLLNPEIHEKAKQTSKNRYGVEFPVQNMEVRRKIEDTMLKRHGSKAYLGTDECLMRTTEWCRRNFGVESVIQVPEIRWKMEQTCLERYGTMHPYRFGSDEFGRLMLERYGTEFPAQVPMFRKSMRSKYSYAGISFDSCPEMAFYIWLSDVKDILDLDFEYSPDISFEYSYAGKRHVYMPDFRIFNQYFELKGNQFFKDGKMVLPFRNKDWTDADVEYMNGLYNAKYKCMLENGVFILRASDYGFFLKYVSEQYGKGYLKQFKN